MSHITRIKTAIVEKEHLLQALRSMGFNPEEIAHSVESSEGSQTEAEVRIQPRRSSEIVFRKVGRTYEVVADWEFVRGIRSREFIRQLHQRYSYYAALDKLHQQGFEVATEETRQDGSIHLVLQRMA